MSTLPHVVIIGGGFGGLRVAVDLEKSHRVRLTLIERNEYFTHNIAGLRAAVIGAAYESSVFMPFTHALTSPNSTLLHASVSAVHEKHVLLSTGVTVTFDYLVIATGASSAYPAKPLHDDITTAAVLAHNTRTANDIREAKNIVIIGGGAVGVELAGEIGSHYQITASSRKVVTLIHSGTHLLSSQRSIKSGVSDKLVKQLRAVMHTTVLLNDRVITPVVDASRPYIKGATTVTTATGKSIEADLIFFTIGTQPHSSVLSNGHYAAAIDATTHLISVNDKLQLLQHSNVYAIGDVSSFQPGYAFHTNEQGQHVAKQIVAAVSNKQQTAAKLGPSNVIVVPLGTHGGAGQLPMFGGIGIGATLTAMIKGKGLFVEGSKTLLGIK